MLVALGACAVTGGVNAMKNTRPIEEVREEVYGDDKYLFPTLPALPLSSVVKVDHNVRGCPMTQIEFLRLFTALVMGKEPDRAGPVRVRRVQAEGERVRVRARA